jgi:hypothetical protein
MVANKDQRGHKCWTRKNKDMRGSKIGVKGIISTQQHVLDSKGRLEKFKA